MDVAMSRISKIVRNALVYVDVRATATRFMNIFVFLTVG